MPPKAYLDVSKVQQKFPDISALELFEAGGQKIVYKGVHPEFSTIMLKFFKTNEGDPRIDREIAIAQKLKHPNLPKLYAADSIEFDDESTVVYLLEEYIDGETLRTYINRGSIGMAICKHFLEVMFSVMQVLQDNNLVHRDLKPENIMIKEDDFFVLDFGIARELGAESITNTASPMGPHTLGYAPWEQIKNEKNVISAKTDLFSIAVICQEMLTNEHPFITVDASVDAMRQTNNLVIKPLGLLSPINITLEEFLHTLMSKLPSSRPSLKQSIEWFNEFKEQMI